MKKFLFVLAVLFIAHLGCKKIVEQPLCACSPISTPYLALVIKDATGDLLNPETNTAFSKNQIQLYTKNPDGSTKVVDFQIRPPFDIGKEKFPYYQLVSFELTALATSIDKTFYLKLGNQAPLELNVLVNNTYRKIEKLLIDKKEAPQEMGSGGTYFGPAIFYLHK